VGDLNALSAEAGVERTTSARETRLRRADVAGQRLFRELVVSRIAWSTVMEASRLVSVDVVAMSLRATGCAHPPPCRLHHCMDRLEVRAVLGNQTSLLPGLSVPVETGLTAEVLRSGDAVALDDYAAHVALEPTLSHVMVECEEIRSLLGVPVSFGGEVRGILYVGLRRQGSLAPETAAVLTRLCGYAGAALAAASDRARVEAVAVARERRRMARVLHDDFGQVLFAIGVSARLAGESARAGGADLAAHLDRVESQVGLAGTVFRGALQSLMGEPASTGGLAVTLGEDIAAFRRSVGMEVQLVVLGEPAIMSDDAELLLVRAGREALRNVDRHSGASEAFLSLCFEPGRVELVIQDDGVGPPPDVWSGRSVGLPALRKEFERFGGALVLYRNEDMGATLRATLPVVV
jgi:signal transduction histidine kinase